MSSRKRSAANTSLVHQSLISATKPSQSSSIVSHINDTTDSDDNRQVSYRSRGLTSEDVQSISTFFENIGELDLSENRMDILPRGIPSTVEALNLSKNKFKNLVGFDRLSGLYMLRLYSNAIERTWGLQACQNLEHLDLSRNKIIVVEGFESLRNLKTLILSNNNIKKMSAIRPLSFNTQLEELKLDGNPITEIPKYRGAVKHLITSLKHLDGSSIFFSDGNRSAGYGVKHQFRSARGSVAQPGCLSSPEHSSQSGSEWNEISYRWNVQDGALESPAKTGRGSKTDLNGSVISYTPTILEDDPADLPWNKCPNPIPKDRHGKEMYEAPPPAPASPFRSPVTSNRKIKSAEANEKRRIAARQAKAEAAANARWQITHHGKPPVVTTAVVSSTKKKKVTGSAVDNTPGKTPIGLSARAKAANIQYPEYQPKFSPAKKRPDPPPPPPPPNKYKVTLGKNAPIISTKRVSGSPTQRTPGSPQPIRGHRHAPKNDILRVETREIDYDDSDADTWEGSERLSQMSPGRRQQFMLGVPVLASSGLRQAVSPAKPTPALHRSLTTDAPPSDEHGARKVVDHYQSHVNDGGGLIGWSPPPLPVEVSSRSRRYDSYADDEDSFMHNMSDFSDEDADENDVLADALQLIYEQKKKTIENIKDKRASGARNDHLLLVKTIS